MRLGDLLRVEITSFVGPDSRSAPALMGAMRLGEDGIVGTAVDGSRVGDARVGSVAIA